MSELEIQGTARVQITLEIDLRQPWGEKANLGEIYDRAHSEALDKLRSGLVIHGTTIQSPPGTKTHARIVGDPKIKTIIVARDKG